MTLPPGPVSYRHLAMPVTGTLERPRWPPGVQSARCRTDRDLAEVHGLLAATYRERNVPFPEARTWHQQLVHDAEYSADTIFLARGEAGALLGVCLCWSSAFVKDLAVARSARRQGIALALLLTCFAHFRDAGATSVELKVEKANATGAERLYRRLGMTDIA